MHPLPLSGGGFQMPFRRWMFLFGGGCCFSALGLGRHPLPKSCAPLFGGGISSRPNAKKSFLMAAIPRRHCDVASSWFRNVIRNYSKLEWFKWMSLKIFNLLKLVRKMKCLFLTSCKLKASFPQNEFNDLYLPLHADLCLYLTCTKT